MKNIFFVILFLTQFALAQNLKLSQLTPLTSANIASNDLTLVTDTSASQSKSVSFAELDSRWQSTALASSFILVGNASGTATARAMSGDASLSNLGIVTLADTGVISGSYPYVTVDSKGRVTGASQTVSGATIVSSTVSGSTVIVNDNVLTIQDNTTPTKKGQVELSGITAGQTRTMTWPDYNFTPSALGSAQTKTTTYTALVTDSYIGASGSAFTITLYAASGNAGKILVIKKTDASLTNIITIDGNASETIDGAATTTLNTQNESVTLYCDGSNWQILQRRIPNGYQSYTPTITGFGTVSGLSAYSWREGRFLNFVMYWVPGTNTATEARASLGFAGTDGNVTTASTLPTLSVCGTGGVKRALPDYLQVFQEASKTYVTMAPVNGSVAGLTKATGTQFPTSDVSIMGKVPIQGWND